MPDEVIRELWQIKDSIARKHGHDLDALVAYLQAKEWPEGRSVVDLGATTVSTELPAPPDPDTLRA